jgi:hypothetical protein
MLPGGPGLSRGLFILSEGRLTCNGVRPFAAALIAIKSADGKADPPDRVVAGCGHGCGAAEEEARARHRQSMRAVRRRLGPGPGHDNLRQAQRLDPDRDGHVGAGTLARATTEQKVLTPGQCARSRCA